MKKNLSLKNGILLVIILFFTIIVVKILTFGGGPEVKGIADVQAEKGIPVDVVLARQKSIETWQEFSGTVKGIKQGTVSSTFPEEVVATPFSVGEFVNQGDVLISLKKSNPTVGYESLKAVYENAKREFERLRPLHEEGAISLQDLDNARTAYEVAKANLEAASSTIDLMAPISGILTDLRVNVGETTPVGVPIATVAAINKVRVVLDVSDDQVRELSVGQLARVEYDDEILMGTVEKIPFSADSETRLFEVELLMVNPSHVLKPGTFVTANVRVAYKENIIVIPADAIVQENGNQYVFLVDEENNAVVRNVKKGISNGSEVEIIDGLKEGDNVVLKGANKLIDGVRVYIHAEFND